MRPVKGKSITKILLCSTFTFYRALYDYIIVRIGFYGYLMILCKVIRDTLQSITYYLGKYHVILFFAILPTVFS